MRRIPAVGLAAFILLAGIGFAAFQTQSNFGTAGVIGPGLAVSTDIPTFNGTSGAVLQDPGSCTLTATVMQCPTALVNRWSTDTGLSRGAAGMVVAGNGTAGDASAVFASDGNNVALTADWTCGTGGTVASCTAATIVGSGGGVPLTFTLPLVARSWTWECDLVVGQATAATANQWNILTATTGATNVTATYDMYTTTALKFGGATTGQTSTTTTFNIGGAWTLGGTGSKMPVHIWGRVQTASASGTVLSLQLVAPTVGDLVTIFQGSGCRIR